MLVDGRDRVRNPIAIAATSRRDIRLFPDKTVLDNMTFGLEVTATARLFTASARLAAALAGISRGSASLFTPHRIAMKPTRENIRIRLSGGMQQRVAIAQALIMKPPILLMDEAFSALDPGTRTGMQRLIKELWRESGTTIVFVTHNTREALCLGTRVVALAKEPPANAAPPSPWIFPCRSRISIPARRRSTA